MNDTAKTAAVLDEMVAGIMGVKANKAAQLTPVGTETAKMPSDVPGVLMAREGLADIAKDLRQQAAVLLSVADGLDVMVGVPEAVAANAAKRAETDRVLAEREADRKAADRKAAEGGDKKAAARMEDQEAFEARMEEMKRAAQAATFADLDDEDEDAPTASGWRCPTHGDDDVRTKTSPKGRTYGLCAVPNCKEFERR